MKLQAKQKVEETPIWDYCIKRNIFHLLKNNYLGISRKLDGKSNILGKRTKPDTSDDEISFDFKTYNTSCSNKLTAEAYLQKYQDLKTENKKHKKCFKISLGRVRSNQKIDRCPHTDSKYYAKGMCSKCYLSFGRNHLATACEHKDRMFYALSMCLQCYHKNKHQKLKNKALNMTKMSFIKENFSQ